MNCLNAFILALSAAVAIASPAETVAQGVDQQTLLHPPSDSWPATTATIPAGATARSSKSLHKT